MDPGEQLKNKRASSAKFYMPRPNVQAMRQLPEQSKVSVEGLFYVIKDNEKELRDCYAEIFLFFYNFSLIISSQVLMHVIVSYNKNSKPKKLKNQNKKKILNS